MVFYLIICYNKLVMSKSRFAVKKKMSILEIIIRFLFCFLLPYVVINGIIFYLYIQVPTITLIDSDSPEYEDSKIKFTVSCLLPISDVKTYYEDKEIAYTKLGDTYIVEANENGSYQINAVALNKASTQVTATIETKDVISPTIDIDNAIITGNILVFSVFDAHSEINYDKLYATLEDGTTITPTYVDEASGNVQFQIELGKKITIHVEDIEGNATETAFTAS